jgi:hypothetical protein
MNEAATHGPPPPEPPPLEASQKTSEGKPVTKTGTGSAKPLNEQTKTELKATIEACLERVKARLRVRYKVNVALVLGNIAFSTVAAIIAGAAGAGGQRTTEAVPGGWRTACYAAAICSFVVTVSSTLSGVFRIPETVTRCQTCQAELELLLLDIDEAKVETAKRVFKKLRRRYSDLLAN